MVQPINKKRSEEIDLKGWLFLNWHIIPIYLLLCQKGRRTTIAYVLDDINNSIRIKLYFSTDVCVPITKLSDIIAASEEIVKNSYAKDLAYGLGL